LKHAISVMGLGAMCACAVTSPQQQGIDPLAVANQLISNEMQDLERRRADDQEQRIRDQQEQTYDREKCLKAGYTGPDVEQCVRDSGLYRRGYRPGGNSNRRSRHSIECTTVGMGDGMSVTDCD